MALGDRPTSTSTVPSSSGADWAAVAAAGTSGLELRELELSLGGLGVAAAGATAAGALRAALWMRTRSRYTGCRGSSGWRKAMR